MNLMAPGWPGPFKIAQPLLPDPWSQFCVASPLTTPSELFCAPLLFGLPAEAQGASPTATPIAVASPPTMILRTLTSRMRQTTVAGDARNVPHGENSITGMEPVFCGHA